MVGGFVGKITVKIPWTSLGKKPIIILIENIFAIVNPVDKADHEASNKQEQERIAKRRKIQQAEALWLENKVGSSFICFLYFFFLRKSNDRNQRCTFTFFALNSQKIDSAL